MALATINPALGLVFGRFTPGRDIAKARRGEKRGRSILRGSGRRN
jgi:hypothetical protein